jgi:hypothetical protein
MQLTTLDLSGNPRLGDDVCDLEWCPNVLTVNVRETAVSARGIDSILLKQKVKSVSLDSGSLAEEEAVTLRQKHPLTTIHWYTRTP